MKEQAAWKPGGKSRHKHTAQTLKVKAKSAKKMATGAAERVKKIAAGAKAHGWEGSSPAQKTESPHRSFQGIDASLLPP